MQKYESNALRVITRDNWDLFWDLIKATRGDMRNFEDDGAWPALIDEFVEYNEVN